MRVDVIAMCVDAPSFVYLVSKLEPITLSRHKVIEVVALLLKACPGVFSVLRAQVKSGFFFYSTQEVRIQLQCHFVHDVQSV